MGDLLQPAHLLILFFVFGMFFLVPTIFYILTLSKALSRCSPASITIEPGMLWLLLVPLVSMVWHFFVVIGLAKTLKNEFRLRNITNMDPMPGQSIGIAMCVCTVCGIIPFVGLLAALVGFVLWIVYWAKIAEFSRMLEQVPR